MQEEGLLTEQEFLMFWQLACKMIGAEEYTAEIAARARQKLEDFPIYSETEAHVLVLEGQVGEIDYYLGLSWHPLLETYANVRIELTAGLMDLFREQRREVVMFRW